MLKTLSIYITGHDLKKNSPGIGPNSWGYLRIVIPYQGLFFSAGEQHDLLYSWGGTEDDKRFADEQFLNQCMMSANKQVLPSIMGFVYFCAVDKFGASCFRYT